MLDRRTIAAPSTPGAAHLRLGPFVFSEMVVAAHLESRVEQVFHPDSYGYRPHRSALDAVGACLDRCWEYDRVVEFDIRKFFDSVRWDLVVEAVEAHTDARWVVL